MSSISNIQSVLFTLCEPQINQLASGQDLCRMDLDIKWWKKKSLSWEPPQILCCWSSDHPLLMTLDSVTESRLAAHHVKERACQTEHGTPEDLKVGLIRRKTLLCQTEHGTLEGLKLRTRICSGISLISGEAPPLQDQDLLWDQPLIRTRICSGISLSSGEAPPLQDQDLLWDQPHQVLSFRDIKAVSVEIKSEMNPVLGVFY
ncbi:2-C-methyl-D-erythritol 4-phosphate cytidylyltransferase [Dissostichus eleginoides]|uniref:2-C-methyl-D-erythritol 4-phosphate cytidylyltransferase n=1 Tax=Dissostichus eleginoides TaxID=100907 RepID=A0AAD9CAQ6_DISEL|nr:2-C-methyl-D-erythritol 4-phosphate cytidylyltransferase [Dissostichus eleginoides]